MISLELTDLVKKIERFKVEGDRRAEAIFVATGIEQRSQVKQIDRVSS